MNGQPAERTVAQPAPRWTDQLDAWRPAVPAAAAAWLREPGLLTERLRACCAGETRPGRRLGSGCAACD